MQQMEVKFPISAPPSQTNAAFFEDYMKENLENLVIFTIQTTTIPFQQKK